MTLRYRDSVSSNASSSLSRNSTISSTETRYFSAVGSPSVTNTQSPPLRLTTTWNSERPHTPIPTPLSIATPRLETPNSLSPINLQFSPQNIIPPIDSYQQKRHTSMIYPSVINPNGCFVPSKPLPFIQKNDITRHHYVIPTFAMVNTHYIDLHNIFMHF